MFHPAQGYSQGYGQPMIVNDWCEVDVINCCKGQQEMVNCLSFDPYQELVWIGNHVGRVQGYIPPSLHLHSAFCAHSGEVCAVQPLPDGIISLGMEGFRFTTRGGLVSYTSSDRLLYGMSCMSYSMPLGQISFAGKANTICNVDLATGSVAGVYEFDTPGTALLKRSTRRNQICCGSLSGSVSIHDSRSLDIIDTVPMHSNGLYDLDVKNDLVVTCGLSTSYDNSIIIDPQIKLFDLRMNRPMAPIPLPTGPMLLKFHPKLSSTLVVVSHNGTFQFIDTQAGPTARFYQLEAHDVTAFDISSSSDIICFGNRAGQIRQWVQKNEPTVNDFSSAMDYPDVTPPVPSFSVTETTPLNMKPEPIEHGKSYLSEWMECDYPVSHVPVPINPKLLEGIPRNHKGVFHKLPNKIRHPKNRSIVEGQLYAEMLKKTSKTRTHRPIILKDVTRPPKKYHKQKLPSFNVSAFGDFNRTEFSGLDNTFCESYLNSIVQTLFYIPEIREKLLQHLCTEEYCICCELGFLFYYMEQHDATIVPNTNLLRTISNIPKAGLRGFLQSSKVELYSSALSDTLQFILDQLRCELHQNINHPTYGTKITHNTNVIDDMFISTFSKIGRCLYCKNLLKAPQPKGNFNFSYSNGESPSFVELLSRAMRQNSEEDVKCATCTRITSSSTACFPEKLSPFLVINANVQTEQQLNLWYIKDDKPFVPSYILIKPRTNEFFDIFELDPSKPLPKEDNIFKIRGVMCQILDKKQSYHQSPLHYVSYINIPEVYGRGYIDSKSKEERSGYGWFLFNDFVITPEIENQVLNFAPWKVPSVIIYEKVSHVSSCIKNPAKSVSIPDDIFFMENPLEKCRLNPLPKSEYFKSVDDLPGKGDLLPIDTEYVALTLAHKVPSKQGRTLEIKPSRSSLARVSVLVWNPDKEKEEEKTKTLLDDYIVTREPIADYLTRFSGIKPGDLNPSSSQHPVLTLKAVYLKLRILVQRGVIFIGHGLTTDFWICNLYVPPEQIRDTVNLFHLPYQRKMSLRFLASHLLDMDIQSVTHDSIEDATTALHLFLKYQEIAKNNTFNDVIKKLYEQGEASKWQLPASNESDFQFEGLTVRMQALQKTEDRVYSDITVYSYKDSFVLEPNVVGRMHQPGSLVIKRGEFSLSTLDVVNPDQQPIRVVQCCGLVGAVRLLAGYYLIIINEKNLVGTIRGHAIYSIRSINFLPFASSNKHLNDKQRRYEATYISMIENLLQDGYFYFSYSLDLTTSLKNVHTKSKKYADESPSLYKMATDEYFWNLPMLDRFSQFNIDYDRWFLPLMRGYVHITMFMVAGHPFDFILISRRSRYRAGTRYLTRGVDGDGRVANYVETEQILGLNLSWCSFLQTRGSIPVYWSQRTNLKYNPKTHITHSEEETGLAFSAHFERELYNHSRQYIVNLLDEKGQELQLTKLYCYYLRKIFKDNQQIDYTYFDFHAECRNGQYENVADLIALLRPKMKIIGVTYVENGSLESVQCGAIRTNCLDCLDRTNLVQSTFARYCLTQQLASFGIQNSTDDNVLDRAFKEAWANNGDAISRQYAGTGALKSDYTRTGKRNTKGKLKDGVNALSRYVINNFHDSLRQIAIDVLLGYLQVEIIDMAKMEEEERKNKKEPDITEDDEEEFDIDFVDWGALDS